MKATQCTTMVLASLLCGCSTTYTIVEPSIRNPYTKAQFTDQILDNEVTVEFRNGEEADAVLFQLGDDSCTWIDPNTSLSRVVRTNDVQTVVKRNHLLGALDGFGIGLLGGSSVGGVTIQGEFAAIGVLGIAFIGAVVGTVYGALAGHKYYYEFVWFTRKAPTGIGREGQPVEKREEQSR